VPSDFEQNGICCGRRRTSTWTEDEGYPQPNTPRRASTWTEDEGYPQPNTPIPRRASEQTSPDGKTIASADWTAPEGPPVADLDVDLRQRMAGAPHVKDGVPFRRASEQTSPEGKTMTGADGTPPGGPPVVDLDVDLRQRMSGAPHVKDGVPFRRASEAASFSTGNGQEVPAVASALSASTHVAAPFPFEVSVPGDEMPSRGDFPRGVSVPDAGGGQTDNKGFPRGVSVPSTDNFETTNNIPVAPQRGPEAEAAHARKVNSQKVDAIRHDWLDHPASTPREEARRRGWLAEKRAQLEREKLGAALKRDSTVGQPPTTIGVQSLPATRAAWSVGTSAQVSTDKDRKQRPATSRDPSLDFRIPARRRDSSQSAASRLEAELVPAEASVEEAAATLALAASDSSKAQVSNMRMGDRRQAGERGAAADAGNAPMADRAAPGPVPMRPANSVAPVPVASSVNVPALLGAVEFRRLAHDGVEALKADLHRPAAGTAYVATAAFTNLPAAPVAQGKGDERWLPSDGGPLHRRR
jgi:hypothetical protein